MQIDISDLRAKLTAATPGEVEYSRDPNDDAVTAVLGKAVIAVYMKTEDAKCDAALRNALPALLGELEALRKLQEAADEFIDVCGLMGTEIYERKMNAYLYALNALREAQGRGK